MKVAVRTLRSCVVSCLVESEVDLEQADLGKFVLVALVQSTSNRGQATRASVTRLCYHVKVRCWGSAVSDLFSAHARTQVATTDNVVKTVSRNMHKQSGLVTPTEPVTGRSFTRPLESELRSARVFETPAAQSRERLLAISSSRYFGSK